MKRSSFFAVGSYFLSAILSPCVGAGYGLGPAFGQQELVPQIAQQVEVAQEDTSEESAEADEEEVTGDEITVGAGAVAEIDPQQVHLELWDGSVISGKLQVRSIPVATEFGELNVPIGKIRKVLPGLDSYPDRKEQLEGLFTALSARNFNERDEAQRQLTKMGLMIRDQLNDWLATGDAEQQKRLKEILDEIQPMIDELEFEGGSDERSLIYKDTLVTDEFTIVGKIQTDDFSLQTKFGDLNISLKDVKTADRTVFLQGESVRRKVSVDAETFFQRSPVSTRIRVRKGDRIKITASGRVNWTNWNQMSGPEGLNGQGAYAGFISGTLLARIGKSGKFHGVGDKANFVADTDGVLYLGIAMQDNYVNRGNNYRWTGEYSAQILVEPGQ